MAFGHELLLFFGLASSRLAIVTSCLAVLAGEQDSSSTRVTAGKTKHKGVGRVSVSHFTDRLECELARPGGRALAGWRIHCNGGWW